MDDEIKRITITLREFRQLSRDSAMLDALKTCGVEDWDGYQDAIDEYNENYNENYDEEDEE
jgi:hypothetical protein